MEILHTVIGEYQGAIVRLSLTQSKLSSLLNDPAFTLVSVNAAASSYYRKKKKQSK